MTTYTSQEVEDRFHKLLEFINGKCTNEEAGRKCLGYLMQHGDRLAGIIRAREDAKLDRVSDAEVERACKAASMHADGAVFPDAYGDDEAESTREFMRVALLAAWSTASIDHSITDSSESGEITRWQDHDGVDVWTISPSFGDPFEVVRRATTDSAEAKDAARYRWLRNRGGISYLQISESAIDDTMSAESHEGEKSLAHNRRML